MTNRTDLYTCIQLQHGAAISEFVAMLAVLVPMFLLVPYLGKVSDMNHTAVQSSRYAAWERVVTATGTKNDGALATEARRRIFSRLNAPIQTGQGVLTAETEKSVLWKDHTGDAMLQTFDDVRLASAESDTPGAIAGTVTDLMEGFGSIFEKLPKPIRPSGEFDVNTRGLLRADMAVNVDGTVLSSLDKGTNCDGETGSRSFVCIRRHNVILADNWDSSSPDQVKSRVTALVPTEIFKEPAQVLIKLGELDIPGNPFQDFAGYEPGIVMPDVVPPDRLGPKQ